MVIYFFILAVEDNCKVICCPEGGGGGGLQILLGGVRGAHKMAGHYQECKYCENFPCNLKVFGKMSENLYGFGKF